ncbi:unnamed protein product [Merluccius merluccius]
MTSRPVLMIRASLLALGSAQRKPPTCCQQLPLRNSHHPSSLSDKGSACQHNKSLARAVLLAAGANPATRPGQSSTVLIMFRF